MKTVKDYMEEADAVVPRISAQEGIERHKAGNTVFIDVRDKTEIAESGTIAGAELITRGMLEFYADDSHPMHSPVMKKDADIVLICGAGGQAALGGKTLKDMGFQNVSNVGGFSAWQDAGGPVQD
ncbi:MAG: rhodanese-like domain-containing protein [Marinosulfonomonas sp.]